MPSNTEWLATLAAPYPNHSPACVATSGRYASTTNTGNQSARANGRTGRGLRALPGSNPCAVSTPTNAWPMTGTSRIRL